MHSDEPPHDDAPTSIPGVSSDALDRAEAQRVRRRFTWRARIGLGVAALVGAYLVLGPATVPVRLPNGRVYEALRYERRRVYATSHRQAEDQLFLAYYAQVTGPDLMHREAALLGESLLPVADSLGLSVVGVKAARPVLTRATGITVSYDVRFDRDAAGHWHETQ